ncbi:MAG: DMT family transporter [Cyclobacteriaceae bacterium]
MEKSPSILAWSMLILLSLIWGSSFILIKRGLEVFTPIELGSLRIASASLFLAPIAISRFYRIKRNHLALLFIIGLMGSLLPAFFFAIAQTRLNSSLTGVLNALTPLFVLMMGIFFFKQKYVPGKLVGMIIGFAGTVALILSGSSGEFSNFNYYALFVVLATIFYGVNLNVIKYYLADLKALTITSVSLLFMGPLAGMVLFGFTPFMDTMQYTEGAWLAFGYVMTLGVVGTALALIIFNNLVQMTTPVFTSSVTYIIPIVAVIWGVVDGEELYLVHYISMAAILAGVYLVNRKRT